MKRARRQRAGFSLIELIGVLSVLAILAAATIPTLFKRMDHAAKTAEQQSLKAISEAFVQASLRDRQISAAAGIPAAAASYLAYNVQQVNTNPRKFPRRFLVDPALSVNAGTLPYVQTGSGSINRPVNGRILILSTIARALPVISPSAAEFDTIWNAPADSVPAPLASWGGKGEDLIIERIELAPLFHKVLLVNVDTLNPGRYSVDSATQAAVAVSSQVFSYVLDGTVLNLFRSNGTIDSREIIREDVSFVYQNNRWGRRLGPEEVADGSFGEWVRLFLLPPAPPDPEFAATQQAVVDEFYSFLWGFSMWALGDPAVNPPVPPYAGQNGSGTPNYPSYSVVYDAQRKLDQFTGNLVK